MKTLGLVVLLGAVCYGQHVRTHQNQPPRSISAVAAANAQITLRVLQNAAEADLIDGKFDPFTAGLLDGVAKNLEEDEGSHLQPGDDDLMWMLDVDEQLLEEYRVNRFREPLRSNVMHLYFDCTHEINVALKRGYSVGWGNCELTDEQHKPIGQALSRQR